MWFILMGCIWVDSWTWVSKVFLVHASVEVVWMVHVWVEDVGVIHVRVIHLWVIHAPVWCVRHVLVLIVMVEWRFNLLMQWLGVPSIEVKAKMLVLMLIHLAVIMMFHVSKGGVMVSLDWMSMHSMVWVDKFHYVLGKFYKAKIRSQSNNQINNCIKYT